MTHPIFRIQNHGWSHKLTQRGSQYDWREKLSMYGVIFYSSVLRAFRLLQFNITGGAGGGSPAHWCDDIASTNPACPKRQDAYVFLVGNVVKKNVNKLRKFWLYCPPWRPRGCPPRPSRVIAQLLNCNCIYSVYHVQRII